MSRISGKDSIVRLGFRAWLCSVVEHLPGFHFQHSSPNQTKPNTLLPDLPAVEVRACFSASATLFVFKLSRMLVQEPLLLYIKTVSLAHQLLSAYQVHLGFCVTGKANTVEWMVPFLQFCRQIEINAYKNEQS